jgi:hypothetical protein
MQVRKKIKGKEGRKRKKGINLSTSRGKMVSDHEFIRNN